MTLLNGLYIDLTFVSRGFLKSSSSIMRDTMYYQGLLPILLISTAASIFTDSARAGQDSGLNITTCLYSFFCIAGNENFQTTKSVIYGHDHQNSSFAIFYLSRDLLVKERIEFSTNSNLNDSGCDIRLSTWLPPLGTDNKIVQNMSVEAPATCFRLTYS